MAEPTKQEIDKWFNDVFLEVLKNKHISLKNPYSLFQVRVLPDPEKTTPKSIENRKAEISETQQDPALAEMQTLDELHMECPFGPKGMVYTGAADRAKDFQKWTSENIKNEVSDEMKAELYKLALDNRLCVVDYESDFREMIVFTPEGQKPFYKWDKSEKQRVEFGIITGVNNGGPADQQASADLDAGKDIHLQPKMINYMNTANTLSRQLYNYYRGVSARKSELITDLKEKYEGMNEASKGQVKEFLQKENTDIITDAVHITIYNARKRGLLGTLNADPKKTRSYIGRGMMRASWTTTQPWLPNAANKTQKLTFNAKTEKIVEVEEGTFRKNTEVPLSEKAGPRPKTLYKMTDDELDKRERAEERFLNNKNTKEMENHVYDKNAQPGKSILRNKHQEQSSIDIAALSEKQKAGRKVFMDEMSRLYKDLLKTDSSFSNDSNPYRELKKAMGEVITRYRENENEFKGVDLNVREMVMQAKIYLSVKESQASLSKRQISRLKVINRILDVCEQREKIFTTEMKKSDIYKDMLAEKLTLAAVEKNPDKSIHKHWLTNRKERAKIIGDMRNTVPFEKFVKDLDEDRLETSVKTNHLKLSKQFMLKYAADKKAENAPSQNAKEAGAAQNVEQHSVPQMNVPGVNP